VLHGRRAVFRTREQPLLIDKAAHLHYDLRCGLWLRRMGTPCPGKLLHASEKGRGEQTWRFWRE
jgi:hypothetical protein